MKRTSASVTRSVLLAAFVACLLGILVPVLADDVFYHAEKTVHLSGIAINSRSSKKMAAFPESGLQKYKTLTMSIEFRAFTVGNYDDVFQTGPGNSGIRMEVSRSGDAGIVIGAPNADGYAIFMITSKFDANRWHSLTLSIDHRNRVRITYDGKAVNNSSSSDLGYEISDVVFGTGMNRTRPFDGEIRNGELRYTLYSRLDYAYSALLRARAVLFVLSLLLLYLISDDRRTAA